MTKRKLKVAKTDAPKPIIRAVREPRTKKIVPYNTGKLLIGQHYTPHKPMKMSAEDEFWQGVLLGDHGYRKRRNAQAMLYAVVLVAMFALMSWFS